MIRSIATVLVLLGLSSAALAQPGGAPAPDPDPAPAEPPVPPEVAPMPTVAPPPEPVEPPKKIPKITVMFAPLRLIVPLVEFTFEYRVMNKLGVSLTAGAGKRTIESGGSEASGTEIELGAQVRYYAIGTFRHGMEVGVELLEEYVKFDEPLPAGVIAVAAGGLTVGPFLGYKIATGVGFTFEMQVGARYVVVEPEAQGASGASFDFTDKWLPLVHINFGWSF